MDLKFFDIIIESNFLKLPFMTHSVTTHYLWALIIIHYRGF